MTPARWSCQRGTAGKLRTDNQRTVAVIALMREDSQFATPFPRGHGRLPGRKEGTCLEDGGGDGDGAGCGDYDEWKSPPALCRPTGPKHSAGWRAGGSSPWQHPSPQLPGGGSRITARDPGCHPGPQRSEPVSPMQCP